VGNPILDEMLKWSYNKGAQSWETGFNFEPCSVLSDFLNTVPERKAIYYDPNSAFPNIKFLIVDDTTPGVRVKVADNFLYLTLGQTAQDSLQPSFSIHDQLLHYKLYYPSEKALLEYWKKPDDHLNNAVDYQSPIARSKYLSEIIKQYCSNTENVLEIGCNIGRNLNYLKSFYEVNGIEISSHAVNLMRATYPQLADSRIYIGDAKEIIKDIPDNSFDVIYSMAVLMHIHPTVPDSFWQDIVRISRKYIITIENEITSSGRNWARNYAHCFERFGAKCIFSEFQKTHDNLLYGYVTRVFDCSKT